MLKLNQKAKDAIDGLLFSPINRGDDKYCIKHDLNKIFKESSPDIKILSIDKINNTAILPNRLYEVKLNSGESVEIVISDSVHEKYSVYYLINSTD